MDPSRSHRIIHVINNREGPGQYKYICITIVTFVCVCFDIMLIKFLIITREKQEFC